MRGEVLRFDRDWTVGDTIGGGGFGQVYEVTDGDHNEAAAKFVPMAPGAERELLFVDLHGAPNVVPVIDSGEHGVHWVLVMPRAEKSLRDLLDDEPVPVLETTLAVLLDVADALAGLEGKVVHRDIKPQNVLYLDGAWCLADFGISRYAEATTAPDTRKFALTYAYAGPERWRGERAEPSTDIYSFGVMAFEMLMGHRPFQGPAEHDYREQHLHQDAPQVTNGPVPLQSLVAECIYKSPAARPAAANVAARLTAMQAKPAVGALAALQAANQQQVRIQAEHTRRESAARSAQEQRAALYKDGSASLERICLELATTIQDHAPTAGVSTLNGGLKASLGDASLVIESAFRVDPGGLSQRSPIQVVAASSISVGHPGNQYGYRGRSHSLWYCDAVSEGEFAWYETAFMDMALLQEQGDQSILPYSLPPDRHAAGAIGPGMDVVQLAWPFMVLRPGDTAEFHERWIGWFAAASTRALSRPMMMPERQAEGSYRR